MPTDSIAAQFVRVRLSGLERTGLDGRCEIEKAAARPAEAWSRSVASAASHDTCQINDPADRLVLNG